MPGLLRPAEERDGTLGGAAVEQHVWGDAYGSEHVQLLDGGSELHFFLKIIRSQKLSVD